MGRNTKFPKDIIDDIIKLTDPNYIYTRHALRQSPLKKYEKIIMGHVTYKSEGRRCIKSKTIKRLNYFKGQDIINFYKDFDSSRPKNISKKHFIRIKKMKDKDTIIKYLEFGE